MLNQKLHPGNSVCPDGWWPFFILLASAPSEVSRMILVLESNSAVKQWYYTSVWRAPWPCSIQQCDISLIKPLIECDLSFSHFSFLTVPPLSLLWKRMHDLWSTIFTSYWAEVREQWRQKRESEREREWTRLKNILLGCMKVMEWAEICFPEADVCPREWSSSSSDLSAVNEEMHTGFCCSYILPDAEDENRTDLCCFTLTHSTSKLRTPEGKVHRKYIASHKWGTVTAPNRSDVN